MRVTRADFVISQSARLFTKSQNPAFDVTNTIEAIGEFFPVTPLSSFGRVHAVFAAFISFFGFSDLIEILLKSIRRPDREKSRFKISAFSYPVFH